MVGRAALSNPAIFDELRNGLGLNDPPKSTPGVEELKREYETLHSHLSGDAAHRDFLLRTLGRSAAGIRY
jgi:tRNA-dihydrouridine synthase